MQISQNFTRSEFACKCGCGFDTVDHELIQLLEKVRAHFNQPVRINSGCRCATHNTNIGGSKNSQHLYGRAADITVDHNRAADVYAYLETLNPAGLGLYSNWVHVDTRSNANARWDKS